MESLTSREGEKEGGGGGGGVCTPWSWLRHRIRTRCWLAGWLAELEGLSLSLFGLCLCLGCCGAKGLYCERDVEGLFGWLGWLSSLSYLEGERGK